MQSEQQHLETLAEFFRPFFGPTAELEGSWEDWLLAICRRYISDKNGNVVPFADRHRRFWEYIWSIKIGIRPKPFIGVWPRGGGKSTAAEMAVVSIGARRLRNYGLYVCATQQQADDHVQNIANLLESQEVAAYYPALASRLVGKFGHSKGWRRNRLRTASGFTVDAIGLDTAARGVKMEADRPGFMVLDDLDEELDTIAATDKKIAVLTKKLLQAGGTDLVVVAIQNLVIGTGLFARLVLDEKTLHQRGVKPADFLIDKIISGPFKAVDGLVTKWQNGHYEIISGTETWAGQNIQQCQDKIDEVGLSSFLTESQHEVDEVGGGMFDHLEYQHCTWQEVPELVRVVVWVDPAVTSTDSSDAHGIQVDGLGIDDKFYRLRSWEERATPLEALKKAILWCIELGGEHVGVETDQGGDTWEPTYLQAFQGLVNEGLIRADTPIPVFVSDKAGAGHGPKQHRASQMLFAYEKGHFVHVIGTHVALERALGRFPRQKPYDLVDAAYWSWNDLNEGKNAYWGISSDFEVEQQKKVLFFTRRNPFATEKEPLTRHGGRPMVMG